MRHQRGARARSGRLVSSIVATFACALLLLPGVYAGSSRQTAPFRGAVAPATSSYTYGCRTSGSVPVLPRFSLQSGAGGFEVRTSARSCTNLFTNYAYTQVAAGWTLALDLGRARATWTNVTTAMHFNISGNISIVPGRCTFQSGYAAYYGCYAQAQVYVGGSAYVEDTTTGDWTAASLGWPGWGRTVSRYDTCAYVKCYPTTYGRDGSFHVRERASWTVSAPFVVGDRYALVLVVVGWASAYLATSVARMPGAASLAQLELDPLTGGADLEYVSVR